MSSTIYVQEESLISLKIKTKTGARTSSATGFIVQPNEKKYLITNYHVLTNRDPSTGNFINGITSMPDDLTVFFHSTTPGNLIPSTAILVHNPTPNYQIFKTTAGKIVDVCAIPIDDHDGKFNITPLNYKTIIKNQAGEDIVRSGKISVAGDQIFAIGFPGGFASGGIYPIWKEGTIASEPQLDIDDIPVILADSLWIPGMSGSPVYRIGSTIHIPGEALVFTSGRHKVFLGVQSMILPTLGLSQYVKASFIIPKLELLP